MEKVLQQYLAYLHYCKDMLIKFCSSTVMVGYFIAIFVMVVLYEGLKMFREVLHRKLSKIFGKIGPNNVQYKKLSS